MPDPTPQEQERARAIAYDCLGVSKSPVGIALHAEVSGKIAAALAEQRERDADTVEAAGACHANLLGDDVPQRMAVIAATYLRSGYDADEVRRSNV